MLTIKRTLESAMLKKMRPNKVILLFGARRVGKTVLIKEIQKQISGRTLLLNGEDFNTLMLLEQQTIANYRQLLNNIDLLIIDEAQNIPDIGKKLKLMVDEIKGLSKIYSRHMPILNQDSFTGRILR